MWALYVLAVVLFVIWIAAVVTHFVVSAAIHVLLGAALVLFVIGLFMGRRSAHA